MVLTQTAARRGVLLNSNVMLPSLMILGNVIDDAKVEQFTLILNHQIGSLKHIKIIFRRNS